MPPVPSATLCVAISWYAYAKSAGCRIRGASGRRLTVRIQSAALDLPERGPLPCASKLKRLHGWMKFANGCSKRKASRASSCGEGHMYAVTVAK
jgi:hypothetical protein